MKPQHSSSAAGARRQVSGSSEVLVCACVRARALNFSCLQLSQDNLIDPQAALQPGSVSLQMRVISTNKQNGSSRRGSPASAASYSHESENGELNPSSITIAHIRYTAPPAAKVSMGSPAVMDPGSGLGVRRNACVCPCTRAIFGCKGTRASVASSVHSLSLIQLAAIWWIPFQGGEEQERLAFTAAGRGEADRTPLHTHTQTNPHQCNDCYSSESLLSLSPFLPLPFIRGP